MKSVDISLEQSTYPLFIISDIHANLPALRAVVDEIPDEADVICAGDLLGYYTEPNEVCELLRQRGVYCIKGNHDKYVLDELSYADSRESKYRIQPTKAQLSEDNTRWVASLPDTLHISLAAAGKGGAVTTLQVSHGSPVSVEEYIYKDTPITFEWPGSVDYLVLGHTHHPIRRATDQGVIINPGSVGQVRDRVPGAAYASFSLATREVTFHRAVYDVTAYQQQLRQRAIDEAMIDILSRVH